MAPVVLYPPLNADVVQPGTRRFTPEWVQFIIRLTQTVAPGGVGPAPNDAVYVLGASDAALASGRVVVDTTSITWDQTTPGQIKANAVGGLNNSQLSLLLSGGQIVWVSAYNFLVSAATYLIMGTQYGSPQTSITLAAADPTNDRIDVVAVNTSGAVVVITGTPAAQPAEPAIDPGTQLKLGIVLVAAGSTSPTVTVELLYDEDTGGPGEWNWTTSGSGITLNSTTNPYHGTKDIEWTAVSTGAYAQGQRPSGTIDPTQYTNLVLYIRSKATWNKNRGLQVTLLNNGVVVGQSVTIASSGTFGFDSSVTASYQQVAIPTSLFSVAQGSAVNQVRVADFGGAIGLYLDYLQFQAGLTVIINGLTKTQADALYAPLGSAFVTIGNDATLTNERALTAGSGISITDGGPNSAVTLNALVSSRQAWLYKANTGATSGYPGDGKLLWDNATQTSATHLVFSHLTSDSLDIDLLLGQVPGSTTLFLQDSNNSANVQEWTITGVGVNTNPGLSNSYWTFPVTLVTSGGTGTTGFPNNHQLIGFVFAPSGGGSGITQLTGDVTAGPGSGSQAATIAASAVTNSKLANMAQATIKGRASGAGTGAPVDLTGTQVAVIVDAMVGDSGSGGTKGEVPAPAAGDAAAGKFLKADGTWTVPGGGGTVTHTAGALALNELVVGNAGADIKTVAATDGQIPIGKSSDGSVTLATLTAGAGVTITNAAASVTIAAAAGTTTGGVGIVIDGGGAVITAGIKGYVSVPVACTITGWRLLSIDASATAGSITIDVLKGVIGSYPTATTLINTGAGGVKPALSSASAADFSSLAHWTTAISAGDILSFSVDATPASVTRVILQLTVTVP